MTTILFPCLPHTFYWPFSFRHTSWDSFILLNSNLPFSKAFYGWELQLLPKTLPTQVFVAGFLVSLGFPQISKLWYFCILTSALSLLSARGSFWRFRNLTPSLSHYGRTSDSPVRAVKIHWIDASEKNPHYIGPASERDILPRHLPGIRPRKEKSSWLCLPLSTHSLAFLVCSSALI